MGATVARNWLKADAKNRAWRTILQGILPATVVIPAIDAALQVLITALTKGGTFSWGQVAASAGVAATTAGLMAYSAYLHRMVLDPSSVPSAQPPRPPGVTAAQAPATDAAATHTEPRTDAFRSHSPDDIEKGD
jgi:hypothetical protein